MQWGWWNWNHHPPNRSSDLQAGSTNVQYDVMTSDLGIACHSDRAKRGWHLTVLKLRGTRNLSSVLQVKVLTRNFHASYQYLNPHFHRLCKSATFNQALVLPMGLFPWTTFPQPQSLKPFRCCCRSHSSLRAETATVFSRAASLRANSSPTRQRNVKSEGSQKTLFSIYSPSYFAGYRQQWFFFTKPQVWSCNFSGWSPHCHPRPPAARGHTCTLAMCSVASAVSALFKATTIGKRTRKKHATNRCKSSSVHVKMSCMEKMQDITGDETYGLG